MGRRANGSLTKRKDGRWQACIQLGGKRLYAYARTKSEAAAKLKELRLKAAAEIGNRGLEPERDSDPQPEARTLSQFIEDWLGTADLRSGTRAHYALIARTYINPHIGSVKLSEFSPKHLEELYVLLRDHPSVVDKVHRILHRCFRVGVLRGVVPGNPCDGVVTPRYQSNRKTLWTVEQVRSFLKGTRGHWLHPLWVLAITTGCRLGELLALRWGDVDLQAGTVSISRSLSWTSGEPVFDVPKTRAGIRTLQLVPQAVEVLSSLRARLDHVTPDSLVFSGPKASRPLYPSVVQHALKRECRRLGIPEMTPHGLRHLHASLLIARGVPIPLVSRQLGHANPGITMTIYAHAIGPGSLILDAIEGVIGGKDDAQS